MSVERTLLAGVGSALTVAGSIAQLSGGPRRLLASLGWDLPPAAEDIGLAALDLGQVGARLTAWTALAADPSSSGDDEALALLELGDAVAGALGDLGDLELDAPQAYLDRTNIQDEFLTRLLDLYLIQSCAVASRPTFDLALLLGWFELAPHEADPQRFQVAHLRHVVHWDRVPALFSDPAQLMGDVYGWERRGSIPTRSSAASAGCSSTSARTCAGASCTRCRSPGCTAARRHRGPRRTASSSSRC